MKKLLGAFVLLTVCSIVSIAQTTQGTLSFGGSIGVTTSKQETASEDTHNTDFNFSPSVGYFVVDKLMLGLNVNINASKRNAAPGLGSYKSTSGDMGPFARYYIFMGDKFAFTAEAGFGFGAYKDKPEGQDDIKGKHVSVYMSPGFVFFPNERWGIDLQFNMLTFTAQDPDNDRDNDRSTYFSFGIRTFSPSIGVRYYLSK